MLRRQNGVGLTELMIGISIGLLILSGTISIYISTIKNSSNTLLSAKLNNNLDTLMNLMVGDIRRAGYWAGAEANNVGNPFTKTSPSSDIKIQDGGSCIMYSYDFDNNGSSGNEVFGFKHVDTNADGNKDTVLMLSGDVVATDDCSQGSWNMVGGSNIILVNTLRFSSTGAKCLNTNSQISWSVTDQPSTDLACSSLSATNYTTPSSGDTLIESRQVTITLEGYLRSDPSVKKVLSETVKIRNDRIYIH